MRIVTPFSALLSIFSAVFLFLEWLGQVIIPSTRSTSIATTKTAINGSWGETAV